MTGLTIRHANITPNPSLCRLNEVEENSSSRRREGETSEAAVSMRLGVLLPHSLLLLQHLLLLQLLLLAVLRRERKRTAGLYIRTCREEEAQQGPDQHPLTIRYTEHIRMFYERYPEQRVRILAVIRRVSGL